MGFPTKVQLIKRKASEQWYVNFPSAIAQAMEFSRGEMMEWVIEDKSQLVLRRRHAPDSALKKTPQDSSSSLSNSGGNAGKPSRSRGLQRGRRRSR
jgi:hypothetical protein